MEKHENEDDAQLAAMGHKPELHRNFSTLYEPLPWPVYMGLANYRGVQVDAGSSFCNLECVSFLSYLLPVSMSK